MRVRPERPTERERRPSRRGLSAARRRSGPAAPAAASETAPLPSREDRYREEGGPQDAATYSCTCGYIFTASVSTTVACPHCGADQAW